MTHVETGWDLKSLKRLLQSKKDKQPQRKVEIKNPSKGLESLGNNVYFYNGVDEGVRVELDGWTQISETQKRLYQQMFKHHLKPGEWTVEYHPPAPKQKTPKVKKPKLGKWDVKLE